MPKISATAAAPQKSARPRRPKQAPIGNAELLVMLEQISFQLEENSRLTKRLYTNMIFGQVMFWIKFLLVLITLALALNYLPPFFGNIASIYQQFIQTETQLKLR